MVEQNEAFIVFGHINKELVTAALLIIKIHPPITVCPLQKEIYLTNQ